MESKGIASRKAGTAYRGIINGFEIVDDVMARFEALDAFVNSEDYQAMRKAKFTSDDFKDGTFRLFRLATELKLAMDEWELLHQDIS
jgi:hypothetical protein